MSSVRLRPAAPSRRLGPCRYRKTPPLPVPLPVTAYLTPCIYHTPPPLTPHPHPRIRLLPCHNTAASVSSVGVLLPWTVGFAGEGFPRRGPVSGTGVLLGRRGALSAGPGRQLCRCVWGVCPGRCPPGRTWNVGPSISQLWSADGRSEEGRVWVGGGEPCSRLTVSPGRSTAAVREGSAVVKDGLTGIHTTISNQYTVHTGPVIFAGKGRAPCLVLMLYQH